MPRIIVPLDGSPRAETALPHARALAAGGPLLLVTTSWDGDATAPREYLQRMAADTSDDVETEVVGDREPAAAICLTARERAGSIVCMATHGRSGLGEALLGSVAEATIRRSDAPIVLVGPHVVAPVSVSPVPTMVAAVDDARTAAAIAPVASEWVTRLGGALWAVEVVAPPPVPLDPNGEGGGWAGEGDGVEAAVAELTRLGVVAKREMLRDVDPARGIVEFARALPASYIVVGTHAREGLARATLGSVAMRIVHRSHCPVLVVKL